MSKLTKLLSNPSLFFRDAFLNVGKQSEQKILMVGFSKWKRNFYQKAINGDLFYSEDTWGAKDYEKFFAEGKKARCIVWGYKEPRYLNDILKNYNIYIERLEDGFLRSVGLGAHKTLPYSYILDKSGALYFDARKQSELESILSNYDFLKNSEVVIRAEKIIKKLIDSKVSKYNSFNGGVDHIFHESKKKKILVIGQVEDDASIKYGCSAFLDNGDLVERAISENPEALVYFKPHPDVLSGARKEYTPLKQLEKKVNVIYDAVSLNDCLDRVDHVYTITSLVGFEALLRDKMVTTFGCPFYSGWGLTDDRQENQRRTRELNKYELFAAAYILYPKYVNPYTGEQLEIEDVIELLQQNVLINDNSEIEKYIKPRGKVKAWAFRFGSKEYRKEIAKMLPEYDIVFSNVTSNTAVLPSKEADRIRKSHTPGEKITFLIWGYKEPVGVKELASELGAHIHRVEDGFIRSIGLGSAKSDGGLNLPWSIVLDKKSIYYNAHEESDIEYILNNYDFESNPELVDRAKEVIKDVRKHKITKYNKTFVSDVIKEYLDDSKQNILVVGQVPGDASLKYGNKEIVTNNDLVFCAATENPEANIIYKPHPATLNNRTNNSDLAEVAEFCQILDEEVSLIDCFVGIDRVYTMTSGAGFEALIHGVSVTCLGSNFYTGWGLTDDRFNVARRKRNLSLEEVFAGFYLIYTRYYDYNTSRHVELEEIINIISKEKSRNLGVEIYNSAKNKFEARHYAECEELLIQALSLRNNAEWKFLLGRCYYEQEIFDKALSIFSALTESYSGIFDWQYYKYLTLVSLGRKMESIGPLRKSLLLSGEKRYVKAEYIKIKSLVKLINSNEVDDFESSVQQNEKCTFQEAISLSVAFDFLGDLLRAKSWFLIASDKSVSKIKKYPILIDKYGDQKLKKSISGKIMPAKYFLETGFFLSKLEDGFDISSFINENVSDYDEIHVEDKGRLSISGVLAKVVKSDILFVKESSLYDCKIDVHNYILMGYVNKIYFLSDNWFDGSCDNKEVFKMWLESNLVEQDKRLG